MERDIPLDTMTPPAAAGSGVATATALITGASSGIGVALAGELAGRGHALTLVARRADRLREMEAELGQEHGVRVEWIAADLTDATERDRIPAEVAERGQFVDLL